MTNRIIQKVNGNNKERTKEVGYKCVLPLSTNV
jgi:hypothetical protein